jgi:hypothetical protein
MLKYLGRKKNIYVDFRALLMRANQILIGACDKASPCFICALDMKKIRVLYRYKFSHPDRNGTQIDKPGTRQIFSKTSHTFQNFTLYEENIIFDFIKKQQEKSDHLKLRKTRESTFSCCGLASKIRPVLLNTLLLAVDDAGIERSGSAKRDNCGKTYECFFHHYVVADIDFQ